MALAGAIKEKVRRNDNLQRLLVVSNSSSEENPNRSFAADLTPSSSCLKKWSWFERMC